jgi:hypothetical protein
MPAMENLHRSIRFILVFVGVAVVLLTPAIAGAAAPGRRRPDTCRARCRRTLRGTWGRTPPFRCHFAVADLNGLVVILREGRTAAAGPSTSALRI